MITPDRTVDEIASGILICTCKDRGDKELCKNCGKPTVKAQVKKILNQERQKRDEAVEATVAKAIELTRQNVPYVTGDQDRLITELKALTQPNNPKI